MLRKYFFAVFKSGKAKFDDIPKNHSARGEINTTNKIPDNLQRRFDEIFELNFFSIIMIYILSTKRTNIIK